MEAVALNHVSFRYTGENQNSGVRDIHLTVQQGECVLLTGVSGCGKSTVLRLINGLAPYFYEGRLEGDIRLMGKSAKEIPFAEISRVCGSVFQNPRSQFFYLNTSSEMAFGCENQGIPAEEIRKRLKETVQEFDIAKLENRNIMKLSGGEKQKIAFAGIYAGNPDIYVLDEPSANLDFDAVRDIQTVIRKLKSMGKTIIISEHRLYYLMEIADRVCYMKDGQIQEEYTIQEFRNLSREALHERGLRTLNYQTLRKEAEISGSDAENAEASGFLELKNVICRYDRKSAPVVEIPCCQIPLHRKIAVIGHNGAGKSTFTDGFCGMNVSVKGDFLIQGKPFPKKQRVRECYKVFQEVNHQLFASSVEEEISLGSPETSKEKMQNVMEILGLSQYRDVHPMAVSGGQKQRIALASAIFSGRKYIFLDEPTSGLDYMQMQNVSRLLNEVMPYLEMMLIITHDLEFILQTCEEVIHIEKGQVLEQYSLDKQGKERLFDFFGEA
ncbi:MAG: ABC transporter ATP-binding protein [Ruminococcus sp.]|nr:ABC transporter ATP-binding protein [Ruminococcus sp.]